MRQFFRDELGGSGDRLSLAETLAVVEIERGFRSQDRTLSVMSDAGRNSGPRSNMYSDQRFTNWTVHERYDLKLWIGHLLGGAAYLPR